MEKEYSESEKDAMVSESVAKDETKVDCPVGSVNTKTAADGMTMGFTPGTKWSVVKDLKGLPKHKDGGVDLNIDGDGRVLFAQGGQMIHAKDGMVIAADGLIMGNPPAKNKVEPFVTSDLDEYNYRKKMYDKLHTELVDKLEQTICEWKKEHIMPKIEEM
jgi:hypothetical protein